jgi:hypothetical protein
MIVGKFVGKWKACEFGFSDGVLVFVIAWTLAMKNARVA